MRDPESGIFREKFAFDRGTAQRDGPDAEKPDDVVDAVEVVIVGGDFEPVFPPEKIFVF